MLLKLDRKGLAYTTFRWVAVFDKSNTELMPEIHIVATSTWVPVLDKSRTVSGMNARNLGCN